MRVAAIDFAFIGDDAKLTELRIHQSFANAMHISLMLHTVTNEFRNRQHLHPVRIAEFDQVGHARHSAIFAHDFADNTGRDHSSHARQVHGRFGLSGTHQHSAFPGA